MRLHRRTLNPPWATNPSRAITCQVAVVVRQVLLGISADQKVGDGFADAFGFEFADVFARWGQHVVGIAPLVDLGNRVAGHT